MAMILNFGSYPQKSGAREPIEWQVLDVKGNKALLVSRYALDCRQYHHQIADVTWETCDLRKWLNDGFLKAAFSAEELERILLSDVTNDDNQKFGTKGGNNTRDRIFCLSLEEAEQYFKDASERECLPTPFARSKDWGAWHDSCYWWLRSPGSSLSYVAYIYASGDLSHLGGSVLDDISVRPALWVKL